jgi:hypothetical protein
MKSLEYGGRQYVPKPFGRASSQIVGKAWMLISGQVLADASDRRRFVILARSARNYLRIRRFPSKALVIPMVRSRLRTSVPNNFRECEKPLYIRASSLISARAAIMVAQAIAHRTMRLAALGIDEVR